MIKTFTYFLKERLKHIIIFSFIAGLLTHLFLFGSNGIYYDDGVAKYIRYFSSASSFVSVACAIVATIIPILEFSFKTKKINVDHYYSLPFTRKDLYLSKFLVGLVEMISIITIIFISMMLFYVFRIPINMFNLGGLLLYYLFVIVSCFVIYTFVTHFYIITNTISDGITNLVMACFALPALLLVFSEMDLTLIDMIDNKINIGTSSFMFPYSPLTVLTVISNGLVQYQTHKLTDSYLIQSYVSIGINIVLTILYLLNIQRYVKNHKAEDASQISDNILSYKLFIPFYVILFSLLSFTNCGIWHDFFMAFAVVIISGYILTCIYKRKFTLVKKDIINTFLYPLVGLSIGIVLSLISWAVESIIGKF